MTKETTAFELVSQPITELVIGEKNGVKMRVSKNGMRVSKNGTSGLLGGTVLASAKGPNPDGHPGALHMVFLRFHGGKQLFNVEVERTSPARTFPRENYYGSLQAMMSTFMEHTWIDLKPIRLVELGKGISTVSCRNLANEENPFDIEVGSSYEAVVNERFRTFLAVSKMGLTEISFTDRPGEGHDINESFSPHLIFDSRAWLSLKLVHSKLDESDSESKENDQTNLKAANSERPR
jgi:hypothetical protein